jgi:hypothetical protein
MAPVTTSGLADFVNRCITRRLEINLRLECHKDIVVEFTRTELREKHTKGDRIKDVSIERMIKGLRAYGYEVKGEPNSENFRVTFNVERYLSQAFSLEELNDSSDYLATILVKDEE